MLNTKQCFSNSEREIIADHGGVGYVQRADSERTLLQPSSNSPKTLPKLSSNSPVACSDSANSHLLLRLGVHRSHGRDCQPF